MSPTNTCCFNSKSQEENLRKQNKPNQTKQNQQNNTKQHQTNKHFLNHWHTNHSLIVLNIVLPKQCARQGAPWPHPSPPNWARFTLAVSPATAHNCWFFFWKSRGFANKKRVGLSRKKIREKKQRKKQTEKHFLYLEPVCPLFLGFNPPKDGPLQSKQGSFGFQVIKANGFLQNGAIVGRLFFDSIRSKSHAKNGWFRQVNQPTNRQLTWVGWCVHPKITLLRVIPTMTCRVVVVRWGLSSTFNPWTGISKQANPPSSFLDFCMILSCPHKHTNHSQTIKQNRHTLLFASKLCHHVPLKWNTMHTKHSQTMPNVLYLRSICNAPLMFWTWNDTSLATKKLQRTRTSIEMVKVVRHTAYFLHCFQLPLLSSSDPHIPTFFRTSYWHEPQILSGISFDLLSDILSDTLSDILSDRSSAFCLTFFLTKLLTFRTSYWHVPQILSDISFDILSDISSDILSDISFDILSDISSDILSDISFDILSDISFDILCDISSDISWVFLESLRAGFGFSTVSLRNNIFSTKQHDSLRFLYETTWFSTKFLIEMLFPKRF